MTKLCGVALCAFGLMLLGCSTSSNSPIAPTNAPAVTGPQLALRPYMTSVDSNYVKVWSDSSWERYGGYAKVNGTTYYIVVTSAGDQYYYGSLGYSGWIPSGGSLIMFDKPVAGWPDSLAMGGQIVRSATFTFQGSLYELDFISVLVDTSSVSVPVGVFDPCIHFEYEDILTVSGSSEYAVSDYWCAIGPGEIRTVDSYYGTNDMVSGYVNGRIWGTLAKVQVSKKSATNGMKHFDIQAMVKQIIQGGH